MIKIVVRQHSHRHHRSEEVPREVNEEGNSSNRKRLNQEQGGSASVKRQSSGNQTSSCIEIKYTKMSSSPATAPKAAMRSFHKSSASVAVDRQKLPARLKSVQQRPRGSLSSCSSSSPDLSGNEEAEYYCSYYPEERRSLNYSLSVFDESSSDELEDQQPVDMNNNNNSNHARTLRAVPANAGAPTVGPQVHHSRSISLVVNPNFDSTSEENETSSSQASGAAGSVKYKRGRNRFHYRQTSHCPVVKGEFREADLLRLRQLKEELEASKLTEAESARLREIGFFLRQISDEFALDRRLTI